MRLGVRPRLPCELFDVERDRGFDKRDECFDDFEEPDLPDLPDLKEVAETKLPRLPELFLELFRDEAAEPERDADRE